MLQGLIRCIRWPAAAGIRGHQQGQHYLGQHYVPLVKLEDDSKGGRCHRRCRNTSDVKITNMPVEGISVRVLCAHHRSSVNTVCKYRL